MATRSSSSGGFGLGLGGGLLLGYSLGRVGGGGYGGYGHGHNYGQYGRAGGYSRERLDTPHNNTASLHTALTVHYTASRSGQKLNLKNSPP